MNADQLAAEYRHRVRSLELERARPVPRPPLLHGMDPEMRLMVLEASLVGIEDDEEPGELDELGEEAGE